MEARKTKGELPPALSKGYTFPPSHLLLSADDSHTAALALRRSHWGPEAQDLSESKISKEKSKRDEVIFYSFSNLSH